MTLPEPRPDIGLMEGYHSPQVDVEVRLNTNESPFPPPPEAVERALERARTVAWNRYPDRSATTLRRAIGALEGIDPDGVLVANGSNEILQTILMTYAGPGRSVLVFEPTYMMHSHIAKVIGSTVLVGARDESLRIDRDDALARIAADRPDVVFVCSPNNPSGTVEPRELIVDLLAAVEAVGGLLVVDEAYSQFASWSAATMIGPDVPLVVTRTYSKTWSMAGARLGYVLGPAGIVAQLDKAVLPYHLDAFDQILAETSLEFVEQMEDRVARLVAGRTFIAGELDRLGVHRWESEANFVLFQVDQPNEVWSGLVERSVLVRNCASWPGLSGCLRVTVGTEDENARFVAALADVLQSVGGARSDDGLRE